MLKIVFFGTSAFAVPILDALMKSGSKVAAVVTSPDKEAGRGKKIAKSPVKEFAEIRFGNILQPEKIDSEVILKIDELKADIGVVASYGKILPKELIDIFPKGILNVHPSLLPKYRGASPIQSAILHGDKETGVSIILLDEKMDHGPILAASKLKKELFELSFQNLHDLLAKSGAELLIETMEKWVSGKLVPSEQDHGDATFTKLIKKEDGKIDWSHSAAEIERMIRAFNPWPGSWTETNGGRLKIIRAEVIENSKDLDYGIFFEYDRFPAVACGDKALKLLIVQPEGKKEMRGDAYLRGNAVILD